MPEIILNLKNKVFIISLYEMKIFVILIFSVVLWKDYIFPVFGANGQLRSVRASWPAGPVWAVGRSKLVFLLTSECFAPQP
ncbi:hypothetical protein AHMF7605_23660 [Adhaeribacter arboris]|uniref:Uncharacterized protein n=1 Tax=Adhaeribacter arboris TaxID=2072846 RepID=A0A2T2YL99_9BACT|nr:hypothetical protein AHMF7605_23660 [Adhaeribacter arboris]